MGRVQPASLEHEGASAGSRSSKGTRCGPDPHSVSKSKSNTRADLEAFGESQTLPGRSGDRPGGVLGALGAVLKAYKRRLGRPLGRLGDVLEPLEAMLEPFGELPRPFWTHPDSSWQHVADLLNFIVFFQ